jgi:hypothetical protein
MKNLQQEFNKIRRQALLKEAEERRKHNQAVNAINLIYEDLTANSCGILLTLLLLLLVGIPLLLLN